MSKILITILTFSLFNNQVLAFGTNVELTKLNQADLDKLEKGGNLKPPPPLKPLKKHIKSIDEELKLRYKDEETGLYQPIYIVSSDKSRLSLLYFMNSDLRQLTGISTFELIYAKKSGNYWLEFIASNSNLHYDSITSFVSGPIPDAVETDLVFLVENLVTLGVGLSYRTTLIQNFIQSGEYFETVSAYLTANHLSEIYSSESYTGLGLKADFGIHKRVSQFFHFGGKMSYNLVAVKRAAIGSETDESLRSLTLHWLSIGFDLSYYF